MGLAEAPVASATALLDAIEKGNELRTKQKTEMNDASSRSHAICQICLRDKRGRIEGKLSLVDLAGSERGQDTRNHNRQLRTESAEINKSLLALKECIRGLATNDAHARVRAGTSFERAARRVRGDESRRCCGYDVETRHGGAAAATRRFCGDNSRRRRGPRDEEIPRRRVAFAPPAC